jgi:hypothetical protein
MENSARSEGRALADRMVNYSDALVAVMFLGASGLSIALADPDVRSSINTVTNWIIGGNIGMGLLVSTLLVTLRSWELDLRVEFPAPGKVRRYSRYFYVARHIVLWLSVIQVVIVLLVIRLE